MQIDTFITSLESHVLMFPDEKIFSDQMKKLLEKQDQHAFDNDCYDDGHFTASMLIMNHEKTKVLFMFHKKLQRWLQFGGHSDGSVDILGTAIREFHEESGIIKSPDIFSYSNSSIPIFDIDIHDIPKDAKGRPVHKHYDIRFLGSISESTPFAMQVTEVDDIRWFDIDEVDDILEEEGLFRMINKIRNIKNA